MAAKQLMLPANRAFNSNGLAISGAQAKLYLSGGLTPANFFADSGLVTSLGSTLTANGAGRFPTAYGDSTVGYRLRTLDSDGAVLDDIDPYFFGLTTGVDGANASIAVGTTTTGAAGSSATVANSGTGTNAILNFTLPAGANGPAGDVAKATDRTALAAITGQTGGATRFLVESGREGFFVWSSANLSSKVTADTAQGIYVAPASDTTGASGAWVRKYSGSVNAKWFGVVGDYNGTTGTDNATAITAAFSLLIALSGTGVFGTTTYRGGPSLYFPAGWYLSSVPIDATTTYKIFGDGGLGWGAPTKITFTAGTIAVRAQAENTSGYNTVDGTNHFSGDNPTIEDIQFLGAYTGANASATVPGILCKRPVNLSRCTFAYFQGDGLLADSTIGGDAVPDTGQVMNCAFINNGGSGRKMSGGDANAWVFVGCQYVGNAGWAIDDESFLGNADIMPKASTNTSGAYKTTNSNATNVLLGAYDEGDQPASSFNGSTLVIGGTHGSGAPTGAYIHASSATVAAPIWTATVKNVTPRLEAGITTASILFDNAGTNLFYSMNLAEDTWEPFALSASSIDMRIANASCGTWSSAGLNLVTGKVLSNNGTTILNGSGVLQAAGVPAFAGGDVTSLGGSLTLSIAPNAVTYAKFNQVAAASLVGNPTGALANAQGITLAADHSFSGTTLQLGAFTGDITKTAGSLATTVTKINGVALSGLATGILKNTTTTGVPSIAIAADFPTLNQNTTGSAATLTTPRTLSITGKATAAGGTFDGSGNLAINVTALTVDGAITPTSVASTGIITSTGAGGIGYATGAGGAVTQLTSRTTGVTLNTPCGAITLVSAAGSATWSTFTVTNSRVAATDTVEICQKSGANLYNVIVTAIGAGTFNVSVSAVSGTATESPVFNFVIIKAVAA